MRYESNDYSRFIRIQRRFTESTHPSDNESLNIALKRSAHALGEQQLRHPILRTLKLALELRVANPSLLFDTRTACRGNEARVG